MAINFDDYKNSKKTKIIAKELKEAQALLTQCIENLKEYKKYVPVMESISTLHNSRTIIEIHLDKYNRLMKEDKNG